MGAVGEFVGLSKTELFVRDRLLGLCVIWDERGVVVSAPHLVAEVNLTWFVVRCEKGPVGAWRVEGDVVRG